MRDLAPEPVGYRLSAHGINVTRAGARLIDGVDIAFPPRGVTVIMGPNGAGKSLLLRVLDGLMAPDTGEVRLDGTPVTIAQRLEMALVLQKPVLLRRSVRANMDFVLKARGRAPAQRDTLLARVGLLGKARQPARALSGGEQQRLALARALALSPKILMLDEPTASLDPGSTLVIEDILRAESRGGTKVIFVTHDIAQAKRLGEDIIFLHRGRVWEQSEAALFFENPRSEPARAYLDGRILV